MKWYCDYKLCKA